MHRSSLTNTVLKALGIFGGVQGVSILAGMVRTKCAALWIGPEGVGIIALFVQTIMTLSYLTQLSLRQSAVRDLSPMAANPEAPEARKLAYAARKLSLWLGIAGTLLTLALAPALSEWTFGSGDYAWGFRLLSLTLLASSLTGADNAILQAFGKLKKLAKANLWGSIGGTAVLAVSLYFWGMNGITVAIMGLPLSLWLASHIASHGFPGKPDKRPDSKAVLMTGKGMLTLGIYLTIVDIVAQLSSYLFTIFLNREASTVEVGIYQSGYTIVNYYVGVIFTAISMEYYPRLSATVHRRRLTSVLVSHEISVALWVLMPFAVLFVCFDEVMVRLLYSSRFLDMLPFIGLAISGVVFRAVSWCIAFVILAKGDGKAYLLTDTLSCAIMLALYTYAWPHYGFLGLGVAYIIWYACYALIVYSMMRFRYHMRLGRGIGRLIAMAAAVCIGAGVLKMTIGPVWTGLIFLPWLIPLSLRALKLIGRK